MPLILAKLSIKKIRVSAYALKEGILFDALEKLQLELNTTHEALREKLLSKISLNANDLHSLRNTKKWQN